MDEEKNEMDRAKEDFEVAVKRFEQAQIELYRAIYWANYAMEHRN